MKVYVSAREGRRVAGLGSRDFGDYFDVDAETARELLGMPGFAKDAPGQPEKTARKAAAPGNPSRMKREDTAEAVEKDDDDAS